MEMNSTPNIKNNCLPKSKNTTQNQANAVLILTLIWNLNTEKKSIHEHKLYHFQIETKVFADSWWKVKILKLSQSKAKKKCLEIDIGTILAIYLYENPWFYECHKKII